MSKLDGSNPKVWDSAAASYNDSRAGDKVYAACTRRAVADLRPFGRVLDAGCGTGLATRMLLGASDVYAVDYSAESLTVLQSSAGDLPLRGLLKADLQRLPFPDESFDCVLCANALQHLNRDGQRKSASEIMRVLRVGGHYSVSVHHFSREKRRAGWIKEGKPGQPGIDYIYRFDRSELRDLFPGASIRAVGFAGWTAQYFISTAFGQALARISLGHMLIASGRKLSIRPRRR